METTIKLDKRDYLYKILIYGQQVIYFIVKDCWNVEDGRIAVDTWMKEHYSTNYNKTIDGKAFNSIIFDNVSVLEASCDDFLRIYLKGTYKKPEERLYEYSPKENDMKNTLDFFNGEFKKITGIPKENMNDRYDYNVKAWVSSINTANSICSSPSIDYDVVCTGNSTSICKIPKHETYATNKVGTHDEIINVEPTKKEEDVNLMLM